MSLLKSFQLQLTCTNIPWGPNKNSETSYLINEIVLVEETDINQIVVELADNDPITRKEIEELSTEELKRRIW